MAAPHDEEDADLRAEARVLAAYLVGAEPEPELAARYAAACLAVLDEGSARDRAAVAWAVRHPRALPFLDGAAGLMRPQSLLRKKLLVCAALLEATPRHADAFLPVRSSAAGLVLRLAGTGIVAGLHTLVGAALLPIAERSRA